MRALLSPSPDTNWEPEPCLLWNKLWDPSGDHNPWTSEGEVYLEKHGVPFRPRWVQLVGVLHMLDQAFKGKPVLCLDTVGLGKTLQYILFISLLSYYRLYYSQNQCFPGMFRTCLLLLE